jgi:ABC-2 type transport system ATP-binding protein
VRAGSLALNGWRKIMLIEIDKLRLSIGGIPILHEVRLSLGRGEIYGLIGPNGAGKSTTIAAALGLLKPDAGKVRVFGTDPMLAAREHYRRLGVLPEQNGFYNWMSAETYLAFFAELYGTRSDAPEISRRLAAVGLSPRPHQPITTYSRGMRQRLGLARALIANPQLLILDEPTNGLDPRGRRDIHDLLLDLAANGVGVLLCTHLLDDVDRLCKRIGIISEGRTVAEGAIADLVRSEYLLMRFRIRLAGKPPATASDTMEHAEIVAHEGDWWLVDVDPAVAPDQVWRELLFSGWPIAEVKREGRGLEDLYLSLTQRRAA